MYVYMSHAECMYVCMYVFHEAVLTFDDVDGADGKIRSSVSGRYASIGSD